MINRDNVLIDSTFIDIYNTMHIYEKWFYMPKKKEAYYMLPSEEESLHSYKSKNYIVK